VQRLVVRVVLVMLACAAWPGLAAADPVSGPHETIDNQFTTTLPNTATGFHYTGHQPCTRR
jgi:hypothetical protein